MFDNLLNDLKAVIAAVKTPSVTTIQAGLIAAADIVKSGADIFATFFGKMMSAVGDCCATCEEFVTSSIGVGMKAVDTAAVPWTAIFALIQILLKKLLPVTQAA